MIFTSGANVGTCQIRSDCYKETGSHTKHIGARFFQKQSASYQQVYEHGSNTCCAKAVLMKVDETNPNFMNYRNYIASLNHNLGGYHLGRWPTEQKREHRVCIYDYTRYFVDNGFIQKNSDLWQE